MDNNNNSSHKQYKNNTVWTIMDNYNNSKQTKESNSPFISENLLGGSKQNNSCAENMHNNDQ